jgi:GNAT superfamily N-acetyltransferase
MTESDVPALAAVYRLAYGADSVTPEAAATEMESAFDGTWGLLWGDASPVALVDDELVAAVQTVRRPSWDDAPGCPWVIEVFTDPRHRRQGFAGALLGAVGRVLRSAGEPRVGLTVDDQNASALRLYQLLGFTPSS